MANNGRRKSKKVWIWVIVAVAAMAGAGAAVRAALKPDNRIDPSKLARVERGDIARVVVATGKIEPRAIVEVKSKASGIVKNIYVNYGDTVRAGQVLAELDKEELEARVREARANLQAAQAMEESAAAALERNKVEAEGPDIPFLKSAFERAQRMHEEKLVAKNVVEEAEKAYQLALNRQSAAIRALAVSRAEITRARAQVAQAKAVLERAEEDLRNSTIVSPIDGLVLSRNVEVGNAVSSILVQGSQAAPLFTLGDMSDVFVRGKVDQADIGKVYLGQPARIVVESFRDRRFEGKVYRISPYGVEKDNVTTFEVQVSIHNPGRELKANMSANAEIILEEKKNVLLVPEAAVLYDKDRNPGVEVPDPAAEKGRRKVAVKLGISNGIRTELLGGLEEGAQVILQ
ncbi:MAG: RND transporter [Bryobacteraceae bacterium]|nr:MAG: RND transporter [Bryobacteraceae bacterium]